MFKQQAYEAEDFTQNTSQFCSQRKCILKYLKRGEAITRFEAETKFSCLSLSQRISELRKIGYEIESKFIKTQAGKRISQYWLSHQN